MTVRILFIHALTSGYLAFLALRLLSHLDDLDIFAQHGVDEG
jgi:hypothetical protein